MLSSDRGNIAPEVWASKWLLKKGREDEVRRRGFGSAIWLEVEGFAVASSTLHSTPALDVAN